MTMPSLIPTFLVDNSVMPSIPKTFRLPFLYSVEKATEHQNTAMMKKQPTEFCEDRIHALTQGQTFIETCGD